MTPEEKKQKVSQFLSGEISGYKLLAPEITPISNIIPKKSIPQQVAEKIAQPIAQEATTEEQTVGAPKRVISSLGRLTLDLVQINDNLERIGEVIKDDYKTTKELNKKELEDYKKRVANRGKILGKKELGNDKIDLAGLLKKYTSTFFTGAGGAIRSLAGLNLIEGIMAGDPGKILGSLTGITASYLPTIGMAVGGKVAESLGKRLFLGGGRRTGGIYKGFGGIAREARPFTKLARGGGKLALGGLAAGGLLAIGSKIFGGGGEAQKASEMIKPKPEGQGGDLLMPEESLKRFNDINDKFEQAVNRLLGTTGGGNQDPSPDSTSIDPGSVTPTGTTQTGKASFYGGPTDTYWQGRPTASGEAFNENAMTAASNTLPLGSYAKVTNPQNGKQVVVKINDTGGFGKLGRVMDLSYGAMKALGGVQSGVIPVQIEPIKSGKPSDITATVAKTRNLPAPSAAGPTIVPLPIPSKTAAPTSATTGATDIVPAINTTYPENFLALYSKLIYQIV